jgi:tetratricopeptide (TPR) repeat protein
LLVLEGRAWLLERDLVRAQAAFVKAVKHDPQFVEAFRRLGQLLTERGDTQRAVRAFERALELSPHDAEAWRGLQRARGLPGRADPASLSQGLAAAPKRPTLSEREPPVPRRSLQDDVPTGPLHLRRGMRTNREIPQLSAPPVELPPRASVPTRPSAPKPSAVTLSLGAADVAAIMATRPGRSPSARAHDAALPIPLPDASNEGSVENAADSPGAVLAMLGRTGIFEPPEPVGAGWTAADQVERSGTRLRGTLIALWSATLLLSVGGYFAWQSFVEHRHLDAALLLAQARQAAFVGDYRLLVDADRMLSLAREKYPRSAEVARMQLLVQSERVLEGGSREASGLRVASSRAATLAVDSPTRAVARAVMAAYAGEGGDPDALIEHAVQAARGQPELLYVLGRLQQRLGKDELAAVRLQAALAAAPELLAASVALAELEQQQGHDPRALESFEAVLKRRPDHVRAQLWLAFLRAPRSDPDRALGELDALSKIARAGTSSDRALWALARARLLARKGQRAEAVEAVRGASARHHRGSSPRAA